MKRTLIAACCMAAMLIPAGSAFALDYDFAGVMQYHNDVLQFGFTAYGNTTVTLFTSSWIDGNQGFDPTLGLWTGAGNLLYFQDDGHTIGTTASNGISYSHGNWDSYYSYDLAAGDYIVTLSAFWNFNNGSLLSDGFRYDRQAPVPITSWNQPLNGYQTADYEFHILNVAAAQSVPEPGTLLLMGSGLAALAAMGRRSLMS